MKARGVGSPGWGGKMKAKFRPILDASMGPEERSRGGINKGMGRK